MSKDDPEYMKRGQGVYPSIIGSGNLYFRNHSTTLWKITFRMEEASQPKTEYIAADTVEEATWSLQQLLIDEEALEEIVYVENMGPVTCILGASA